MSDESSKVILSVALRRRGGGGGGGGSGEADGVLQSFREFGDSKHSESRFNDNYNNNHYISNGNSTSRNGSSSMNRHRIPQDRPDYLGRNQDGNISDAELSASRRFFLDAERREMLKSKLEEEENRYGQNLSRVDMGGSGTNPRMNALALYKLYEREVEKVHHRETLVQLVFGDLKEAFAACGPKLTCTVELKGGMDALQCPVTFLVIEMIVLADESAFSVPSSLHRHAVDVIEDQDGSVNTPRQLRSSSDEPGGLHSSSRPSRASRLVSPAFDSNEGERDTMSRAPQSSNSRSHWMNASTASSSVASSVQSLLERRRVTRTLVLRDAVLAHLCGLESISNATPETRCDDGALSATCGFIGAQHASETGKQMVIDWEYTTLDGISIPDAIASRAAHFLQRDVTPLSPRALHSFLAEQQQHQQLQRERHQGMYGGEFSASTGGTMNSYRSPYNTNESVQQMMHSTQLDSFHNHHSRNHHHHQHSHSPNDTNPITATTTTTATTAASASSSPTMEPHGSHLESVPHRRTSNADDFSVYRTSGSVSSTKGRTELAAREAGFTPTTTGTLSLLPSKASSLFTRPPPDGDIQSLRSMTNQSLVSARMMDGGGGGNLYNERPVGLYSESSHNRREGAVVSSRALHSALQAARSVGGKGEPSAVHDTLNSRHRHNDDTRMTGSDLNAVNSSFPNTNTSATRMSRYDVNDSMTSSSVHNTSSSSTARSSTSSVSKMQTRKYLHSLEEELRNRSAIHAANTVVSTILHDRDDHHHPQEEKMEDVHHRVNVTSNNSNAAKFNVNENVSTGEQSSLLAALETVKTQLPALEGPSSPSSSLSSSIPSHHSKTQGRGAIDSEKTMKASKDTRAKNDAIILVSSAGGGGGVSVVRISLPALYSTSAELPAVSLDRFESFIAGKASTNAAFQDLFRTALLGVCPVSAAAKVEVSAIPKDMKSLASSAVEYLIGFQLFVPAKHEAASIAALHKYFELSAMQHARNGVCLDWRQPNYPLPTWVSITQRWITKASEPTSNAGMSESPVDGGNGRLLLRNTRVSPFQLDVACVRVNNTLVCPEGVLKKTAAPVKGLLTTNTPVSEKPEAIKPPNKKVLIVDNLLANERDMRSTPLNTSTHKEANMESDRKAQLPLEKMEVGIVGALPPQTSAVSQEGFEPKQSKHAKEKAQKRDSGASLISRDTFPSPDASLTEKQREAAIAAFIFQYDALHSSSSTPYPSSARNSILSNSHHSRAHAHNNNKNNSGSKHTADNNTNEDDEVPFTMIVANSSRGVEGGVSPNSINRRSMENPDYNSPPPHKPRHRKSADAVSAKSVSSDRTPSILFQSTYVGSPLDSIPLGSSFLEKCRSSGGGGSLRGSAAAMDSTQRRTSTKDAILSSTGVLGKGEQRADIPASGANDALNPDGSQKEKKKNKLKKGDSYTQGFAKPTLDSAERPFSASAGSLAQGADNNSLSTPSLSSQLPSVLPHESEVSSLSVSTLSSRSLSSMHDRTRDLLEDLYLDSAAMKQVREAGVGKKDAAGRSAATTDHPSTTAATRENTASTSSSDPKKVSSTALPSSCATTRGGDSAADEHSLHSVSSSAILPPVLQTTVVFVPKTSTTSTSFGNERNGDGKYQKVSIAGNTAVNSGGVGGRTGSGTGIPAFDTSATVSSLSAWGSEDEEVEEENVASSAANPTGATAITTNNNTDAATRHPKLEERREPVSQKHHVAVEPAPVLRAKSTSAPGNHESIDNDNGNDDDDDDDDSNDFGAQHMDPYLVQVKQLFRRHRSVTSSSSRSRPTSQSNSLNTSESSGAAGAAAPGRRRGHSLQQSTEGTSSSEREVSKSSEGSSSREKSTPIKDLYTNDENKNAQIHRTTVHSPYAGSEEESERAASRDPFPSPVSIGKSKKKDNDDEDATVEELLDVSNLRLGSEWDDARTGNRGTDGSVTVPYGSRAHRLTKRDWFIEINSVDSPSRAQDALGAVDDVTPSSSLSLSSASNNNNTNKNGGPKKLKQSTRDGNDPGRAYEIDKDGVVNSSFEKSVSNSSGSAGRDRENVLEADTATEDSFTEQSSVNDEAILLAPLPTIKRPSSTTTPWMHENTRGETFEPHQLHSNAVLPLSEYQLRATPTGGGGGGGARSQTEATSTDESSVFRVLVTFSDVCWSHFIPCGMDAFDCALAPSIPYGDAVSDNNNNNANEDCDTSFGCPVGRWKSGMPNARDSNRHNHSSLSNTQNQVVQESVEACYGALRNAFRQDWVNILTDAFARQSAVPGSRSNEEEGRKRRWKWNFDVVVPSAPVQPDDVANDTSAEYDDSHGHQNGSKKNTESSKDALSVYALIYVSCEREENDDDDDDDGVSVEENDDDYEEAEESLVLDIILDYISRDNALDTASRRAAGLNGAGSSQYSFPLTLQCAAALMLASQEAVDPSHWSLVQKDCAPFSPTQTVYAGDRTNGRRNGKNGRESVSPRFMMQTSKLITASHEKRPLVVSPPTQKVFSSSPQAATWVARAVSVAAGALMQSTYTVAPPKPQPSRVLRGIIDHQQSYVNGVPVNILID